MLQNSPTRQFTMSIRIPNSAFVAASALKAAYLALFSLLGARDGYEYVHGTALVPVRRLIADPNRQDIIRKHISKAPDELLDRDIMLISQPVPCWMVKVENRLVTLPLAGDGYESSPLWHWHKQTGNKSVYLIGLASWKFQTFGVLRAVHVHLAGADKIPSLLGRVVSGKLPEGHPLTGTCIRHRGETAILLCKGAVP